MKKIDEMLLKFEKNAAKILIITMIVLVFMSGIARFLRNPMNWAVDMSSLLFGWACFFAIDVAWRENKMMSVDLLVKKLPPKVQKAIRLVNYFIILTFSVYLVIWGSQLTYTSRFRRFQGIFFLSYSWVNASVPVGGFLLARTTLLKIISEFRKNKVKEEK